MDTLTKTFNHLLGRNENMGLFDGMFDLNTPSLLLVLALCLVATKILASITDRTSVLEYVVTFSSLLIGALLAHAWIAHIELPVTNELAQTVVTANIGMVVSALLLMALYRSEA